MRKKRLRGDWYITDGVFAPVRLGAPACIFQALTDAGTLREPGGGLSCLSTEWVMRRRWKYTLSIETGDEADTPEAGARRFLRLTGLSGAWHVRVNREDALSGCGHQAIVELNDVLSRVEIEFEPEPCELLIPSAGFGGEAFLCTSGAVALKDYSLMLNAEGAFVARALVNAAAPCACEMLYVLKAPDGDERKYIGHAELAGGADEWIECAPFVNPPQNVQCETTLSLRVGGALTDEMTVGAIAPPAPLRGFALPAKGDLTLICDAGGNTVVMPGTEESRRRAHECALVLTEAACAYARPAPQMEEAMREAAGSEPYWPPVSPVWALTESSSGAFEGIDAADGCAIRDQIALSRYRQAEALREAAEDARALLKDFLLAGAVDARFKYASPALIDADMTPRPAYAALKDAWQPAHAYARAPESVPKDGVASIPVYCVCDANTDAYTVRARGYALNGEERVAASFPIIQADGDPLGRLSVEFPADGFLLMRLTVTNKRGDALSRSDVLISAQWNPVFSIGKTQLLVAEDYIENAGSVAALGVCVSGAGKAHYCAFLPGERLALPAARGARVEGLNIYC